MQTKSSLQFLRNGSIALAVLLCSPVINSLAASQYLKGEYSIDSAHTRVSFVVPHFVVSEVEGRFNDVVGSFILAEPFVNSTVKASVPISSIDTGVKKRDEDLRSKRFFDSAKYPEMKLISKSITGTPEAFRLTVALTIKDVTRDVVSEGVYTGSVKDPWGKHRAALRLTATVNRKDFHINYDEKVDLGPAVGDEVKIRIWTEGVKTDEQVPDVAHQR